MSEETPPESTPEILEAVPVDPQPPAEPPATEPPAPPLSEHPEVPVIDAEIQPVSGGGRFHIALPDRVIKIVIAAAGGLIVLLGLSIRVWHHARHPSAGALPPPHVVPSARQVTAPSPATPASSIDQLRSWIDSLGTVAPGPGQPLKAAPSTVIAKAVPVPTAIPVPTTTPTPTAAKITMPTPVIASTAVAAPVPTQTDTPTAPARQPTPAADILQTSIGTTGLPEWRGEHDRDQRVSDGRCSERVGMEKALV